MADSKSTEVHALPQEVNPLPQEVNPLPQEVNPPPQEFHTRPQEDNPRPQKTPKLEKPDEESKTTTKYRRMREEDPESDDYISQLLLFNYDFKRTQGFGMQWDKFNYVFRQCKPSDGPGRFKSDKTNEEVVEEITLRAIAKYNEDNGTNIVLVAPIESNYAYHGYIEFWITFWAKDMSSPSPELKIYQANTLTRLDTILLPIFRVKPTDEEMAANPIKVDLPPPIHYDYDKPPVVVKFAGPGEVPGPGDVLVPGTPYMFNRNPPKEEW